MRTKCRGFERPDESDHCNALRYSTIIFSFRLASSRRPSFFPCRLVSNSFTAFSYASLAFFGCLSFE